MPWLCWERFFSMLYMDKGSSLNLDPMLPSNYVVIMIMVMFIYVSMHVCMSLSNKMMIALC